MINLIKKYRFTIIGLLVLMALLLFFIPNEESRYLQPDIKELKNKTQRVLIWTLSISFGTLLLFGLRQLKKLTDIFYLFAGLGFVALPFYFFLQPLFFSSALLLNQVSKKETATKTYQVVYVEGKRSLLLWDNEFKTHVQAHQLIQRTHKQNIKVSDTLGVTFKKGWLGYLFDPTIE
jgi:hypothetical protein